MILAHLARVIVEQGRGDLVGRTDRVEKRNGVPETQSLKK